MRFSRMATQEDFERETERWNNIINDEVKEEISKRKDKYRGVARYRNLTHCGVDEAKKMVRDYIRFLEAMNDFNEGKVVYVEY